MHQRSWVSHCIIPCPGIERCEFYKPGEANHPVQHTVSKVVNEDESFPSYTSSKISVASSINSNKNSNKKLVLSGTFLDNLAPVPFDPKLDPPQITACFNCWRTNHRLKDCYAKKRNKFCNNCGRKYVEVEDCPRCSKAYFEYIEEEEHIRAKIELYGDVEGDDYYEKRKELEELKLVKNTNPPSESIRKKDDFWNGSLHDNDSRTNIPTNTKAAGLVSTSVNDSKYKDEYKSDHKNVSTNFVKEFKYMNLTTKDEVEQEMLSTSHHMMDSNTSEDNYEEHTESNKSANCTVDSKFESNQVNYEGLKKVEDGPDSHNNSLLISKVEDENEDLDNLIFVDEDEKSMELGTTESNVTEDPAYQHLLSVIRNLPEEAQKVAMRCFTNSQKRKSQVQEVLKY